MCNVRSRWYTGAFINSVNTVECPYLLKTLTEIRETSPREHQKALKSQDKDFYSRKIFVPEFEITPPRSQI